jgi:hypothetical protein
MAHANGMLTEVVRLRNAVIDGEERKGFPRAYVAPSVPLRSFFVISQQKQTMHYCFVN